MRRTSPRSQRRAPADAQRQPPARDQLGFGPWTGEERERQPLCDVSEHQCSGAKVMATESPTVPVWRGPRHGESVVSGRAVVWLASLRGPWGNPRKTGMSRRLGDSAPSPRRYGRARSAVNVAPRRHTPLRRVSRSFASTCMTRVRMSPRRSSCRSRSRTGRPSAGRAPSGRRRGGGRCSRRAGAGCGRAVSMGTQTTRSRVCIAWLARSDQSSGSKASAFSWVSRYARMSAGQRSNRTLASWPPARRASVRAARRSPRWSAGVGRLVAVLLEQVVGLVDDDVRGQRDRDVLEQCRLADAMAS